MLKIDCDWAENFTIGQKRSIQSEYWVDVQASLFITISKLLDSSLFEAKKGVLAAEQEVTVEIPGATDPFWAEVVSGEGEEEEAVYTVRDEKGQDHVVQRQYLRERKWGTVAFSGVTPDTKHDTYASQCFLKKTLQWWEDHYVKTGKENINSVHIHSDNASHFKSRKSMHFLSQIKVLFAWVSWVTWSFGCPGHGKGPWDGFGGMLKRVMRRAIIDGGVVMRNGKDVYDFLVRRFCTEEWKRSHSDYTINQIVVQYAEHTIWLIAVRLQWLLCSAVRRAG